MPSWSPPLNIGPPHIDPATAELLMAAFVLLGVIGITMMIAPFWPRRWRLRWPW